MNYPLIFRRIFQGVYAVLLIGFFGTIAVSGTYGAFYAPPDGSLGADQPPPETAEACTQRFVVLDRALAETARQQYGAPFTAEAERTWRDWRSAFEGRLNRVNVACRTLTSAADDIAGDLRQLAVSHDHALGELRGRGRSAERRLDVRLEGRATSP